MKDSLFIFFQNSVPKHLITRFGGNLAESENKQIKTRFINFFLKNFDIDMSEAKESDPGAYKSFNAFFTRALKPGIRPIDEARKSVACPADGAISQLGRISDGEVFQAKGQSFDVTTLLGGDAEDSAPFQNGEFATIYLSPRDYHRVHMPIDGKLLKTIYCPGPLFSVNQTTAENVDSLFARNERLVSIFETAAGPMAYVMVGAMIVGGIETVWQKDVFTDRSKPLVTDYSDSDITLNKGEELGRFKVGSTVILTFAEGAIKWRKQFVATATTVMGEGIADF
ncbi:MAG: phosphatidylserine decarboxylase [Gammaproteobacteria bacterium]|jgi:phosphatidylserine decarboxylase